jgi:hypothetical protein
LRARCENSASTLSGANPSDLLDIKNSKVSKINERRLCVWQQVDKGPKKIRING